MTYSKYNPDALSGIKLESKKESANEATWLTRAAQSDATPAAWHPSAYLFTASMKCEVFKINQLDQKINKLKVLSPAKAFSTFLFLS